MLCVSAEVFIYFGLCICDRSKLEGVIDIVICVKVCLTNALLPGNIELHDLLPVVMP